MPKLLLYLILITITQAATIISLGQTTNRSREVVRKFCPLSASNPELTEDFTRFYVVGELNLKQELDSLFSIVNASGLRLKSRVDSASFYFCSGLYHSRNSNFDKAQQNFTKAEYLYHLLGDKQGLIYTWIQLANLNYYIKLEEKAYNTFNELAEDPDCDDYVKSKLHHNIGCLAMEVERDAWMSADTTLKNPVDRKIMAHFDTAISYHHKSGNRSGLAATYSVYVNELLNVGDLKRAKSMADSSAYIAEQMQDYGRLAFAQIKQGMILDTLGRKTEAIEVFDKAINYFARVGNISQKIHAMSGKRKSQTNAGLVQEALVTSNQMYLDRLEFFDSELAEAHQRYEVEYETKKKQLTIQSQEAELEKNRLEITNRTNLLAATFLGAVAIGAFLLLLLQRNKRRAREEKDALLIKSKQEGIKAMIQAQEEERQRIAKDLHDGIVQQLGGLKLGLQKKLSATEDPESIRLIQVLDNSAQELRELSHRMMPRALKELGLIPALEDMLENSLGASDMNYEFDTYGIKTRMPESIEITLYRIAQELINNVIKHSAATHVSIQLFRTEQDFVLIVEDNGHGFQNSKKKGIGLLNISSRLDSVNGHVNFEPSPESGTLATIRIPITP